MKFYYIYNIILNLVGTFCNFETNKNSSNCKITHKTRFYRPDISIKPGSMFRVKYSKEN